MKARLAKALVSGFVRCRSGNFAAIFALAAPVLLGIAGGAVDLMVYNRQQAAMQAAADAAVLAAGREASLKNWTQAEAESVARAYVETALADEGLSTSAVFSVQTTVDSASHKVAITVDMDQHNYFLLGYFRPSPQIRVKAAAQLSSETPICLIALETTSAGAVKMKDSAKLFADGCAAFSNSLSAKGIDAADQSLFKTAFTCSAGGFSGAPAQFSPSPTTDCPPMPDPLAGRPKPTVGACDQTGYSVKNATVTINPGVYCGGLLVDDNAHVTMKPGTYIINGGEFGTKNNGSVSGAGVSIYFTGTDGRLGFDGTSAIDLSAPATGPMAGILMYQDPAMIRTAFEISSKTAGRLLGTIYLPNGDLKVEAPGKVADQSAFTVIVARSLRVGKDTQMYLNSSYSSTNVPVPNGLGPSKAINLTN